MDKKFYNLGARSVSDFTIYLIKRWSILSKTNPKFFFLQVSSADDKIQNSR